MYPKLQKVISTLIKVHFIPSLHQNHVQESLDQCKVYYFVKVDFLGYILDGVLCRPPMTFMKVLCLGCNRVPI